MRCCIISLADLLGPGANMQMPLLNSGFISCLNLKAQIYIHWISVADPPFQESIFIRHCKAAPFCFISSFMKTRLSTLETKQKRPHYW